MEPLIIYHNPRCQKSRETLKILEERDLKPKVVEYLKTPPTAAELKKILKKLGLTAQEIIRKKEELFKTEFAGKKLSEKEWIEVLVSNPVLIERPIVVKEDRAVLGRPPEAVLKLLRD